MVYRALGPYGVFTHLIMNITFYVLSLFRNKSIIWLFSFIWLLPLSLIHKIFDDNLSDETNVLNSMQINELRALFIVAIGSWNVLKSLSFCLDKISDDNYKNKRYGFIDYLCYSFYLPTILVGPIIVYSRFERFLQKEILDSFTTRSLQLLKDTVRCLIYYVMLSTMQHFIFMSVVGQDLQVIRIIQ